jgi:beta-glucosidase-like glycosyl hydrolase
MLPPRGVGGRQAPFEMAAMATLERKDVRLPSALRGRSHRLKAVGITLDYAPVLDITRTKSGVGDRALAEKAEEVASWAAIVRTLRTEGSLHAASISGHGDTSTDSPRTAAGRARSIGCAG